MDSLGNPNVDRRIGNSNRIWRAILVGALLSFLLSVVAPYGSMMIHPADISADFATPGAIFFFFVFLIAVSFIKLIDRRLRFSQSELIVIYSMMIVAAVLPSYGLVERFIPILVGAFYFATPENRWAEVVFPYIKNWMVPRDPLAIKYFFEGLPKGEGIPWGAWVGPLAVWLSFILVLYFVMICVMAILRKQWMENEKLVFPLTQLSLEMVREERRESGFMPFLRNKVMWLGFMIPFTVSSWNSLHNYFYFIPNISLGNYGFTFLRNAFWIVIKRRFVAIGLAYFVSLDVSLGVWLLSLLTRVERSLFNLVSFGIEGGDSGAAISGQNMGAMVVFVLYGLWMARLHLRDVFRKALTDEPNVDDSEELLPYRTAVFGIIGGLGFMVFWLKMSGLPLLTIFFLLFIAFVVFIGLTRIVSQGGVGFASSPSVQDLTIRGLGSSTLNPIAMVALGFTQVWTAQRTLVMASTANVLKLSGSVRIVRRTFFWAIIIAILVALCGSIWTVLRVAHSHGGINLFNDWLFRRFPISIFDSVTDKIENPVSVSWGRWIFVAIGATIMGFLIFMRNSFMWWPIHYVGYPVADTYPVEHLWFSIFMGWLLKAVILKYGGPKLYRRGRPFFLGLILGQVSCAGMWLVIDFFTGKVGNIVSTGVY